MKKNLLYLFGFMLLFSCQVDDLEQSNENLNAVYSKSKKNNNNDKKEFQYICHKLKIGNDWNFITLYLPENAIKAHLDHGDELGKCPEDASTNVDNENNSCNCSGNVTRLDLRYNGAAVAQIIVSGSKANKPIYREKLRPGDLFTLHGYDKNGTLGADITISVMGEVNTIIETNCAEPNMLGYTYGDFTIEGGASLNGGEFCPGMVM